MKPSQSQERSKRGAEQGGGTQTGCLVLVATPIGNLGDITARALEGLKSADLIACEDSRVTSKLLQHAGIEKPLLPYHDHNAEMMRPKILARIAAGERVALVSDAGTPLISDPGYKLVQAAVEAGLPVTMLPGPSAPIMALALSGLPSDRFLFAGFLPSKSKARRDAIAEAARAPVTLIFFETAPRLIDSLQDLQAVLGDRRAAVARELTKLFEEVRRHRLSALIAHYEEAGPPKGEIVIVVGPPEEEGVSADDVDTLLRRALQSMSVKDAAATVAAATGTPKRTVYARALEIAGEKGK
ncbi:16S rRNA (cytidine(1402)-2'-O)-methyltransferase [Dongia deserti]|uniref:16S rRNA (cytidine(1402)-2'-O)-methyltransferase n=1 Tax=Dongia deserti TaxID=2268030 RepID=UPI000E6495C1|nr:16S rRNA (cytidine(1402)-2'-O)-methyltransferase [Dongia deserti]